MLEPAPDPSKEEVEERTQQEKKLRGEIFKEQIDQVVKHLDTYVQHRANSAKQTPSACASSTVWTRPSKAAK